MNCVNRFEFYSRNFLNGNCFRNFYYNNTKEPREVVIAKVVSAAIVAGLITLFISISLIPVTVILSGTAAFIYKTAEARNPSVSPPRLVDNGVTGVRNQRQKMQVYQNLSEHPLFQRGAQESTN